MHPDGGPPDQEINSLVSKKKMNVQYNDYF